MRNDYVGTVVVDLAAKAKLESARAFLLELWGEDRERQIELFANEVLPHLS